MKDAQQETTDLDADMAQLDDAQVGETLLEDIVSQPVQWIEFPDAVSMRAHIFNTSDIQEELVDVPEWKMQVRVRGMSGIERATVLQSAMRADGTPDLVRMYPAMVIATCYHPTKNEKVFTDADGVELNKKAGGVLERLAMTASRLSGLDQTEQIKKN